MPFTSTKGKKGVKKFKKGDQVIFISDDPASPIDFSHFCENEGYDISIKSSLSGLYYFTLLKT